MRRPGGAATNDLSAHRQVQTDHAVLVETHAVQAEHLGNGCTNRHEQERATALRVLTVHRLFLVDAHADVVRRVVPRFLSKQVLKGLVPGVELGRSLMRDQHHAALLAQHLIERTCQ